MTASHLVAGDGLHMRVIRQTTPMPTHAISRPTIHRRRREGGEEGAVVRREGSIVGWEWPHAAEIGAGG